MACLFHILRVPRTSRAEPYGLDEVTLFRLAQRALAGKPLDPVRGPQPALDGQSDEALRAYAALEGEARPTRDEMKELILAEAVNTKNQRLGAPLEPVQGELPQADKDKQKACSKKLPSLVHCLFCYNQTASLIFRPKKI